MRTISIRFVMESPTVVAGYRHEFGHGSRSRLFDRLLRFLGVALKNRERILASARCIATDRRHGKRRRQKHGGEPKNRIFPKRTHIGSNR